MNLQISVPNSGQPFLVSHWKCLYGYISKDGYTVMLKLTFVFIDVILLYFVTQVMAGLKKN